MCHLGLGSTGAWGWGPHLAAPLIRLLLETRLKPELFLQQLSLPRLLPRRVLNVQWLQLEVRWQLFWHSWALFSELGLPPDLNILQCTHTPVTYGQVSSGIIEASVPAVAVSRSYVGPVPDAGGATARAVLYTQVLGILGWQEVRDHEGDSKTHIIFVLWHHSHLYLSVLEAELYVRVTSHLGYNLDSQWNKLKALC